MKITYEYQSKFSTVRDNFALEIIGAQQEILVWLLYFLSLVMISLG